MGTQIAKHSAKFEFWIVFLFDPFPPTTSVLFLAQIKFSAIFILTRSLFKQPVPEAQKPVYNPGWLIIRLATLPKTEIVFGIRYFCKH